MRPPAPRTFAIVEFSAWSARLAELAIPAFTLTRRTVAAATELAAIRTWSGLVAPSEAVAEPLTSSFTRTSELTVTRTTTGELRSQFVERQLSVLVSVQCFQRRGRVRDLVGRDLTVSVGVQRPQQRRKHVPHRAAPAPSVLSKPASSTLSIRAAIARSAVSRAAVAPVERVVSGPGSAAAPFGAIAVGTSSRPIAVPSPVPLSRRANVAFLSDGGRVLRIG